MQIPEVLERCRQAQGVLNRSPLDCPAQRRAQVVVLAFEMGEPPGLLPAIELCLYHLDLLQVIVEMAIPHDNLFTSLPELLIGVLQHQCVQLLAPCPIHLYHLAHQRFGQESGEHGRRGVANLDRSLFPKTTAKDGETGQ